MAIHKKYLQLSIGMALLIESFVFAGAARAQESSARILKFTKISEFGIGVGGLNYQGDIASEYNFENNRLAATIFYRKVISQPLTLKASLTAGFFHANDSAYTDRPFQLYRGAEIDGKLIELGVGIEYYFLDYYDFNRFYRWSPYFFAGPNLFYYATDKKSNLENNTEETGTRDGLSYSLTMGAGMKFSINRSWNFGVEFGPRLVLSQDFLDDLTEKTNTGAQLSNPHDRDWYIYNGIFVSYTFYKTYCPSIYKNNTDFIFD
ncbi:MAG: hypothetical protein EOO01_02045 [Chitinophagaceae bacterium]|nr:MAG: hypothetical protein EOO01_02045 [Chitinophagaceae bacterium]